MQPRGRRVGQVDGEPGGAVTQPGGDQARPSPGTPLFLGELFRLVLLEDLRRQYLQHPAAQDPQLTRTEVRRLRDQVRLRPGHQLGRDLLGWQLLQRAGDHPRLVDVELTLTQRRGNHAPAPVQRLGERQVAAVGREVGARLVGEQRPDVAGTLGHSDIVRSRHHPQLQRAQLRLEPGQLHQRRPLLRGRHERDLHIRRLLQRSPDRLGTRQHRMHVVLEDRAHRAPPDSTTGLWFSRVDAARL